MDQQPLQWYNASIHRIDHWSIYGGILSIMLPYEIDYGSIEMLSQWLLVQQKYPQLMPGKQSEMRWKFLGIYSKILIFWGIFLLQSHHKIFSSSKSPQNPHCLHMRVLLSNLYLTYVVVMLHWCHTALAAKYLVEIYDDFHIISV